MANLLAYVEYLQCQQWRSLSELAAKFETSVRSVQRHLSLIRDEYPNALVEAKLDNRKVFRCPPPAAFAGASLKTSDVLMMHTLNKAVHALKEDGCTDDADQLMGFVDHLRRNLAQAARKRCDELLTRLAACDNLGSEQGRAFDDRHGIKRRIQLALIADRDARFQLCNGSSMIGKPLKMQAAAYGACLVIAGKDAERVVSLAEIVAVLGVDDLLAHQYAA